jgi:endonuclease YncB( thermonuclease family)
MGGGEGQRRPRSSALGEKVAVSSRPFYKSVFDALIFAALVAMIIFALKLVGLLEPETGEFVAGDGDSLHHGDQDIRLHGIDAPELHQLCADPLADSYPCGQEARRALTNLIRGHTLSCTVLDTDRYGRSVARCLAGDLNINGEMVRLGWAIAYRKHSLDYVGEEVEARNAGRGLWQGKFENPEAWRAAHRDTIMRGDMGE